MGKARKLLNKKVLFVLFLAVALAVFVRVLRGPFVSDYLRRTVLADITRATGYQVDVERIFIKPLPLVVEARGVTVAGPDKREVLRSKGIKAYVNLSSLFSGHVTIQRLSVLEPTASGDRKDFEALAGLLRGRDGAHSPVSLEVKVVTLKGGRLTLRDSPTGSPLTLSGLDATVLLRNEPEVSFSVGAVGPLSVWHTRAVEASVEGEAVVGPKGLRLDRLEVKSLEATLKGKGTVSYQGRVALALDLALPFSAVKEALSLENPGEGTVRVQGKLEGNVRDPALDMKIAGGFRLATLMEALGVHGYTLTGQVDLKGTVSGPLSGPVGRGRITLSKGRLFGLEIDETASDIAYENGQMRFTAAQGRLYGGTGRAEASIGIPRVRPYTLDASFEGIDSHAALELVGLGFLNLPPGRVKGELHTAGMHFDPHGEVVFTASRERPGDPVGRIRKIAGKFDEKEDVVTLQGFTMESAASEAAFSGTVDRGKRELSLDCRFLARDLRAALAPHFPEISGEGAFAGSLKGSFEEPVLEGDVEAHGTAYGGYPLGSVRARVRLGETFLEVDRAQAVLAGGVTHAVRGTVTFTGSTSLFDFGNPSYDLAVSLSGAPLGDILVLFGKDIDAKGKVKADFTVKGKGVEPTLTGPVRIRGGALYGHPVTEASFLFSLGRGVVSAKDGHIRSDGASLDFQGHLSPEGSFAFEASGGNLALRDLVEKTPVDYTLSVRARGEGTFENPSITLEADLARGSFRGQDLGNATVHGVLTGDSLLFKGVALDGKATVQGKAGLTEELPWNAEVDLEYGRYAFLLTPLLKQPPQDLTFNVLGHASLSGDRKSFGGSARFGTLTFTMYGQGFANDSDIVLALHNREIRFQKMVLRSGNTSLRVSGGLDMGSSLDVTLEGSTSLAPLTAFSDTIETLRGTADFVFTLQGPWERPSLDGGLTLEGGHLAVADFPHRFSDMEGYLYVDDNKVIIEDARAKVGGGRASATGVVELEKFGLKRFQIETRLEDVNVQAARNFPVNIGGNIVYVGTPRGQDLTGDIRINRAVYRKRVDWKTWLVSSRNGAPKVAASRGWPDTVGLNVHVQGAEHVRLDNNIARAPVEVDLNVQGTVGAPKLFGRVEASEGKVYFRNSEFRILHATVDFMDADSLGPLVTVAAETNLKGYRIWLNLEGRMGGVFDLNLSSDPHLEEEELLALLTLGDYGENLTGLESGIGASEATSFLTGEVQDVIEERLTNITGLDRVQIDPHVSRSTGTLTPRITVSKTLLSDKLYVTYSSPVSSTEEQEIRLELLLGENVSLLGGRDDRGSVGADITFRFRFE
jgi:autotransporter translocation and assembly factor TamB